MSKWRRRLPQILAVIGVLIALAALVPQYIVIWPTEAQVVYRTQEDSLQVPPSSDAGAILGALHAQGIPTGRTEIEILNKGRRAAEAVRVGLDVDGKILDVRTVPAKDDEPVWVSITSCDVLPNEPSSCRLELRNLAPGKTFKIIVNHQTTAGDTSNIRLVEVVSDGKASNRLEELTAAESDEPSLLVVLLGVTLVYWGFVLGLVYVVRRNPRGTTSRVLALAFRALNPFSKSSSRKVIDELEEWQLYRDQIAWECVRRGYRLTRHQDGFADAKNPTEFWDLILSCDSMEIRAVVQDASQYAYGLTGTEAQQRAFLLRCLGRMEGAQCAWLFLIGEVENTVASRLNQLAAAACEHVRDRRLQICVGTLEQCIRSIPTTAANPEQTEQIA